MPDPVRRTSTQHQVRPQQKTQKTQKPQDKQNDPSIGKLLVNRAGAVVLAPLAGLAGVLTLGGSAINGAVNPNTTFDQAMQKGIQSAGQGADMLQKMWDGKFF